MDFSFADKNTNCVLIVSEDTEDEAINTLNEIVLFPNNWRIEQL